MLTLRAYGDGKSFYGTAARVEIYAHDYAGTPDELHVQSVIQSLDGDSDEHFTHTAGQKLSVVVRKDEAQDLSFLFTTSPQKLMVVFLKGGVVKFKGWMVHDTYKQAYEDRPDIEFSAICGIGNLKLHKFYTKSSTEQPTGWLSVWTVLTTCINALHLDIPIVVFSNLYESRFDKSVEPLMQVGASIDSVFKQKPEATFSEVLEFYLKPFGQLRQSDGRWVVFPWETYKRGMKGRAYSSTLQFIDEAEMDDSIHFVSAKDYAKANGIVFSNTPTIELKPMLRALTVEQEAGGSSNMLDAFSLWNKKNWIDTTNSIRHIAVPGASVRWIDFTGYRLMSGETVPDTFYIAKSGMVVFDVEAVDDAISCNLKFLVTNIGHPAASSPPWGVGVVIRHFSRLGYKFLTESGWSDKAEDAMRIVSAEAQGQGQSFALNYSAYNIPDAGKIEMQFYIKFQSEFVSVRLEEAKFSTEAQVDATFRKQYSVVPGNQEEAAVNFSFLDMPDVKNGKLLYSRFFTLPSGEYTRSWSALPDLAVRTLMEHIAEGIVAKRSTPTVKMEGDCIGVVAPMSILEDTIGDGKSYMLNRFSINHLDDSVAGVTMMELPGYAAPGSSQYIQLENGVNLETEDEQPLELEDAATEPISDFEHVTDFTFDARYSVAWNGKIIIGSKYGVVYAYDGTSLYELVRTYTGMVDSLYVDSNNKLWLGCYNNSAATAAALFSFTEATGLKREADLPAGMAVVAIGEFSNSIYCVSCYYDMANPNNHVKLSRLVAGELVEKLDVYSSYKDLYYPRQNGVVTHNGELKMFQGNYYFCIKDGLLGVACYSFNVQMAMVAYLFVAVYNSSLWVFERNNVYEDITKRYVAYSATSWDGPIKVIGETLWILQDSCTHVYKNGVGQKLNYVPRYIEFNKDKWKNKVVGVVELNGSVCRVNRNNIYKFVGTLP